MFAFARNIRLDLCKCISCIKLCILHTSPCLFSVFTHTNLYVHLQANRFCEKIFCDLSLRVFHSLQVPADCRGFLKQRYFLDRNTIHEQHDEVTHFYTIFRGRVVLTRVEKPHCVIQELTALQTVFGNLNGDCTF